MTDALHIKHVLDHGYVALLDYMGTDASISEAARISFERPELEKAAVIEMSSDTATKRDRRLIRYLMRHRHTSPFEMIETKWALKLPMDVMRQLVRHRTASINEYSTRYMPAIEEKHRTAAGFWRLQSPDSKQGSLGFISSDAGAHFSFQEKEFLRECDHVYTSRLDAGIAREQARKDLPLSTYTAVYWKIDMHNLLHFLKLRLALDAQAEIRQYAYAISKVVEQYWPITWEAFKDYHINSITFSRQELTSLAEFLHTHLPTGIEHPPLEKNIESWMDHPSTHETFLFENSRERSEFIDKVRSLRAHLIYEP